MSRQDRTALVIGLTRTIRNPVRDDLIIAQGKDRFSLFILHSALCIETVRHPGLRVLRTQSAALFPFFGPRAKAIQSSLSFARDPAVLEKWSHGPRT